VNTPKIRIKKGPEIDWIAVYNGTNSFLLSVQAQYRKDGGLSPAQINRIQENMRQEQPVFQGIVPPRPYPAPRPQFSVKPGDQLEIKHFVAQRIAQEQDIRLTPESPAVIAFRNIEVVEVLRESEKAIQVRIRYISKIASHCHLCGMALDTEISRACGIGPTCAGKLGFKRPKVADAAAILAKMEEVAQRIGVIGPVWLPKSQIVDTAYVASEPPSEPEVPWEIEMKAKVAEWENEQEEEALRNKEEEREKMSRGSQ
jgi:hypothetical protein